MGNNIVKRENMNQSQYSILPKANSQPKTHNHSLSNSSGDNSYPSSDDDADDSDKEEDNWQVNFNRLHTQDKNLVKNHFSKMIKEKDKQTLNEFLIALQKFPLSNSIPRFEYHDSTRRNAKRVRVVFWSDSFWLLL